MGLQPMVEDASETFNGIGGVVKRANHRWTLPAGRQESRELMRP